MFNLLKSKEKITNTDVRTKYGNISGIVGIILNLCLFMVKIFIGFMLSSVSVIADAFNNLSDVGSSVVTFIGFRLARKPADREHPFGHGRYEYVAGLGISVLIFLVGIELIKSSVEKIMSPVSLTVLSTASIIILIVSVVIKLLMYFFNKILSKKINSATLKATALDSLTDSIATIVVLLGLVISKLFNINIDGWLGIAVALFILFTGVATFRDSLSPLLGNPPSAEFVNEIKQTVLNEEMIVGIHDLIVHDYGPGRCIISLHAEIPCDEDILKAHDKIDLVEKTLERKFNCLATIHIDPIASKDKYTMELRSKVADKMCEIDDKFSIHDFRIVRGDTHINVIFDLLIPYKHRLSEAEIRELAKEKIRSLDPKLIPVMHIEKSFTECC